MWEGLRNSAAALSAFARFFPFSDEAATEKESTHAH
jgi:hypothetical protein